GKLPLPSLAGIPCVSPPVHVHCVLHTPTSSLAHRRSSFSVEPMGSTLQIITPSYHRFLFFSSSHHLLFTLHRAFSTIHV
ncbi:MAG: hypothetical protein KDB84_01350, partial [Flavobacteriales bacterium]|nr:hypothetical protein [Flavobacteriales bacterium]